MMRATCAVAALALLTGCAGSTEPVLAPEGKPDAALMAHLWIDPGDTRRDLFWGVGGKRYAPPPDARYELEEKDETGFSVSFDVESPDGVEWSAKIGPEAQTEVVVSRLLWGLGYHQPPVYYLPSWNLAMDGGKLRKESEARFRPKLDHLERLDEYWHWNENPFIGTRPFNGLLVILLMLNSTDLKDDNNSIYELEGPWPLARGAEREVRRWFVVRDIGAALGETGKLYPRRNWLEGFEKEGFIEGVEPDGSITFAFTGRHQELLEMITPADLRWAARRLQRLTDRQWRDAFRAANYTDAVTARYLAKIRQKIDQALATSQAAGVTDADRR